MTLTISLALLALFFRVGEEKKRYLPYYFFLLPLIVALDVKIWGWHLEEQKAYAALLVSLASIFYGISHVIDQRFGKRERADKFVAHIAVLAFASAVNPASLLFAAFLAFMSGEREKLKRNGRPGRDFSWCFPLACAGLYNVTAMSNGHENLYAPQILLLLAAFILLILPERHSVLGLWTLAAFALLEGMAQVEFMFLASSLLIFASLLSDCVLIKEKMIEKLQGKTWFEKIRLNFELRRHSSPVETGTFSAQKAVLTGNDSLAGNSRAENNSLSERIQAAHILYYGFLFIVLLLVGMWS